MPILTAQERLGTVLDGKYRLDRVLGEGGMGVVYDGTHLRLDRRVAVKFLHAHFSQSGEVVQRFIREAQATSRLQHPNVVAVHDVDVAPDGSIFMVLEFLEGQSFAQYLETHHTIDKIEMLKIIGPVCDALVAAHAAGIVHRDIKPDNVLLSVGPGGRIVPKVLDFGIAKLSDTSAGSSTQTGSVMGTPLYMSPEQAMGRTKDVGPLSDLWSTAVMTYEALTGRPPFDLAEEATATMVVLAVVTGDLIPLKQLRPEYEAISDVLTKALDRDVARRYTSIAEFCEALRRACELPNIDVVATRPGHADPQTDAAALAAASRSISATRTPFATPSARPPTLDKLPESRGWIWAVALGVVGLLVAGAAVVFGGSGGSGPPPSSIVGAPSASRIVPPSTAIAATVVADDPPSTVTTEIAPLATVAAVQDETPTLGAIRDSRRRDRGAIAPASDVAPPSSAASETPPASVIEHPITPQPNPPASVVVAPPPSTTTTTPTHRAGAVSVDDF